VAALCLEHGADEDTAIAGLLHDAIEDQGGDIARTRIGERFGKRVLAIVEDCTDADTTPKPPWRARKEAHLAHLADASPEARLVVAADKLHNARSLLVDYRVHGDPLWQRFNAGREDTLWYYRSVASRLRSLESPASSLIDELERTIEALARESTTANVS
jgi:(p)ppGpp synthase/HD superfamily hydrolase